MRNQAREPRTYELLTILSPDVPEEEIPGALDRIGAHVADAGGTVQETLRDSPWGRRRLAYPIRHGGRDLRDGFYTLFHLDLPPNQVEALERDLKLNTQIIRYLVTHYRPRPLDPQAIEDAEIAAEDAAAAAYAAAQAEAARLATEASGSATPGEAASGETAEIEVTPEAVPPAGGEVAAREAAASTGPVELDGDGDASDGAEPATEEA